MDMIPERIAQIEATLRSATNIPDATRQELLDLLLAPLTDADLAFAPIPAPLDLEQRRAMAAMKDTIVAIAAELGMPEGLLCARRHLESLLTERAWPTALNGWRRPILHDALMTQMP